MVRRARLIAPLLILAATVSLPVDAQKPPTPAAAQKPRATAAPGFVVEEVYAAEQSGSVVALTFDSDGQLVISREEGPVVRVLDRDNDGRLDAEQIITDRVTNCQGLLFDGRDLLAVGVGPKGAGLYRVQDRDGDGAGDHVENVTLVTGQIEEHGPHAIVFGPDGFLYWMLGNHTGIVSSPHPLSPYREWQEGHLLPAYPDPIGHATDIRAPGGFVARLDLKRGSSVTDWEMVNGGFRNAYDLAFNLAGELFTFDSDMEWDLGLPWYRPARTNHLVPGADYGWRTGSGVWPSSYVDGLPELTNVGRGSPVGVVVYQGDAYPREYRDALLLGDWSRGRIIAGFLQKTGATYTEKQVDFVVGTPLNVTDIDVGPDEAVYFSRGGRGTEGGIFRVVHSATSKHRRAPGATPVDRALSQPQPRSAWGRAAITRARQEAGARWQTRLEAIARESSAPPERRVGALELLEVHGPALDEALLRSLGTDEAWEVRAASTYHLGLRATDTARHELARRLKDADPVVRRRACEALVRSGIHPAMAVPFDPVTDLLPLLGDNDRRVRYAAREALRRVNRNRWREAALSRDTYPAATEALLALVQTARSATEIRPLLARELELLQADIPDAHLLAFLRVVHLTMQRDEGVNYSEMYGEMAKALTARFPTPSVALNREMALTLAYVGNADAIPKIVAQLGDASTQPEDQIFYVYCLRAIQHGWEAPERRAVVSWFKKTQDERWKGGASFLGYLQALWDDFANVLPEAERRAALQALPSFDPERDKAGVPIPRNLDWTRFSSREVEEYLLWDPMAYAGDATRGQAVYEKAQCVACHRFGDIGQDAGPDLTDVARRFKREDLLEAILYPSKTISDQWASRESPTISPMPEGLLNALSLQEMRNLFAFLEQSPP